MSLLEQQFEKMIANGGVLPEEQKSEEAVTDSTTETINVAEKLKVDDDDLDSVNIEEQDNARFAD